MAFAISAYFPLGFYQGSDSGGRPEEFPSLCRLYSALVSVAYLTFGFEQVDANRNLTDDQIREALNWLEDNPPQGMLLPHAVKADSRAVAYRNKGNVQNRKKPKDKVSSTTAHIATAYEQHPESGRLLTWIWHECPSSTARMVLSWLCNEVPYLGEACSPVELNTYEDYVLPSGVDEQLWTLSPDSALTNIQNIEEISGEHNAEVLSDKVQNDMQESLRLIRAAAAAESTSSVECSLLCFEREHSCFDVDGNEIIREVRWIVSSASENAPDSESDQEIIVSRKKTLFLGGISNDSNLRRKEGHQDHVAWRAQALGKAVGLDDTLTNDLRIAGEYHDEGKKDRRFQRLLRNDREVQETELWAKSRYFISHAKERGLRNEYRLHGWRHEQRSVAEFLQASKTNERLRDMEETDKQLVARLIGTSHGHGRASFQYGTEYLLPVEGGSSREMNPELNVLSDRLFETGEWETLIDHTNQRYGFWGVSYLEALLRAADITCSKEGL